MSFKKQINEGGIGLLSLERKAFLVKVVEYLQELESWCGETHIQKNVFFSQHFKKIPLNYDFILYKHGPFSFELRDELISMVADKFFTVEVRNPFGASYMKGPLANKLEERYFGKIQSYFNASRDILNKFGKKNVKELEKLATVLFFLEKEGSSNYDSLARKITELKSHISEEEVKVSIKEINDLKEKLGV